MNSLQSCIMNLMLLNHCFPPIGIPFVVEMLSGVTVKFKIPTFEVVPVKLLAKSLETCRWQPYNLWKNCKQQVVMKISMVVGSSLSKLMSMGSYLWQWPPLFVFFLVAMGALYLLNLACLMTPTTFESASNLLGSMKQLSRNPITCKDKVEYEKNTNWVMFYGLNDNSCLNHDTCMLKRVMMTSDIALYLWNKPNRLEWPPS